MAQDHGASIKNDATYEALREQGASKEKAARIANAQENDSQNPSKKGGESSKYEERSKKELYSLAQDLDIDGRSQMSKEALIKALRKH
ncbi:Rho termination factor [Ningiella sp. W23]|uniref:DUF7218 family protein n=1 Tax=Ningiella sp. W23 TaxID=3023715 RepID=UPI0037570C0F